MNTRHYIEMFHSMSKISFSNNYLELSGNVAISWLIAVNKLSVSVHSLLKRSEYL